MHRSPVKKKLRIIFGDDDTVYPDGLEKFLSHACTDCIITRAVNGKEVIEFLNRHEYDLVLLDYNMPVLDGIEATKLIKQKFKSKVIIISEMTDPVILKEIFDSHPDGYYLKQSSKKYLVEAIETIMQGKYFYSSEVVQIMVEYENLFRGREDMLTEAEWKVLMLKLSGLGPDEIAAERKKSIETINSQLHSIYDKLGNNHFTLYCYAVKYGQIKSLSFFTLPEQRKK